MTRSPNRNACPALAPIAFALLLCGCAQSPVRLGPPVEARPGFSTAPPSGPQAPGRALGGQGAWWNALGEPELDRLMSLLEANNPNVQSSNAALRSARAGLDLAASALLPSLSATASANRSGPGGPGQGPSNAFKAGLAPSWEVDLWGRLDDGRRAAESGAEGAEFDRQGALLSARSALANAWLSARNLQRQAELGSQSARRLASIAKITSARVELGAGARSDMDAADAALQGALADQVQTRLALSQAERAIASACGVDPASFRMPDGPIPAVAELSFAPSQPAALLARRPDVRAALARLAQADASRAQAEAQILPSLTLSGSASSQAASLGSLFSSGSLAWGLGAQLAATVFDGGARRANAESAAANVERADASYRQTALQALSEAEDALEQARMLASESDLRSKAALSAERGSKASLAQYQEGAISRLALEQALAGEISAKSQALEARSRLAQARLSVARSFAGSVWDMDGSAPAALAPASQAPGLQGAAAR